MLLVGIGAVAGAGATLATGAAAISGWGHGHHGTRDPGKIAEHLDHKAPWVLDALDANEEQKLAFGAALSDAVNVGLPMVQAHRERHHEWVEVLTAPTIDLKLLDNMRTEALASLDEATYTLLPKLAAMAEVLTPEQRAKIATHLAKRHGHSED